MDDHDALVAESEYLRARERELKDELARNAQELGLPLVTKETAQAVLDEVVDALRRCGNGALADKYASAFADFTTAATQLQAAVAAGHVDEQGRDEMNAAEEQFERIAAEAYAWFDKCEKGGA